MVEVKWDSDSEFRAVNEAVEEALRGGNVVEYCYGTGVNMAG